jgi:branched-chain amino acid transport system substrate-binding protein
MRGVALLATLSATALSVAACGSSSNGSSTGSTGSATSTPTATNGKVVVGLVVPLTGPAATYGIAAKQGVQTAIDELNEKGGVNGKQLALATGDDQLVPTTGVNEMRRLVQQQHASVLIGGVTSDVAAAEAAAFAKSDSGAPLWLLSKLDALTTQNYPNLLLSNLPFSKDAAEFYPKVDALLHPKRVAALFENSDQGKANEQGVVAQLGDRVVQKGFFETKSNDFSVQLTKVAGAKVDMLAFAAASDAAMGQMFRQLKQFGIKANVTLTPGTELTKASLDASKNASGRIITGDIYVSAIDNPNNQAFVARFQKAFGHAPSKHSALGYEETMITAQAMTSAGCTSGCTSKIMSAVRGHTFDTERGQIAFDAAGLGLAKEFFLSEVKDGKVSVIQ